MPNTKELSDDLLIIRKGSAPHYYRFAQLTEDGKADTFVPILDMEVDDHRKAKRAERKISDYLGDLVQERDLPKVDEFSRGYGAWRAPVGLDETVKDLIRKAEIEVDIVPARRKMKRELEERRVKEPIKSINFGRVRKKDYGPHGNPGTISQTFEVVHENGTTYTGKFLNIFDAGTTISFDHRKAPERETDEPLAHVSAGGEGQTEAEKEVLRAVRKFGDVPNGIRM